MASEASFTQHKGPQGITFHVKPARTTYSGYVFATVIYMAALFLKAMGAGTVYWMSLFVAGGVYHYLVWKRYRREPVTLIVNEEGLQAGSDYFARSEIHSVHLCQPWTNGGYRLVDDNPVGLARAERSYALMVRRTSSSKLLPIARGLSYRAGVMLRDDVVEALDQ